MSNDEYKTSNDILGVETGPAASRSSIGYGRPPAKGQFKPGQSGNPRGRPRRRDIDLSVYLSKALDEQAPRNSLQKGKRRSNQLAFVQSLMDRALSGDGKALPPLMRLLLKADQFKLPPIPNDQHALSSHLLNTGAIRELVRTSESSITAQRMMASPKSRLEAWRTIIHPSTTDGNNEFHDLQHRSFERIRASTREVALSERSFRKSEGKTSGKPKYDDRTSGGPSPDCENHAK